MLAAVWKRNDRKARILILSFSVIVFLAISMLSRYKLNVNLGFDVHYFALANAIINSMVAVLLLSALAAVKALNYQLHKRLMITAMILSILFLVSYICHHLFAGETRFGGGDPLRTIYRIILFTHIPLAGIILPFILFTAYRGMTGNWSAHKKLARITWPIWFYVAISGVAVYILIRPYYT